MATVDIKVVYVAKTIRTTLTAFPAPSHFELGEVLSAELGLKSPTIRFGYIDEDGDKVVLSSDEDVKAIWPQGADLDQEQLDAMPPLRLFVASSISIASSVMDKEKEKTPAEDPEDPELPPPEHAKPDVESLRKAFDSFIEALVADERDEALVHGAAHDLHYHIDQAAGMPRPPHHGRHHHGPPPPPPHHHHPRGPPPPFGPGHAAEAIGNEIRSAVQGFLGGLFGHPPPHHHHGHHGPGRGRGRGRHGWFGGRHGPFEHDMPPPPFFGGFGPPPPPPHHFFGGSPFEPDHHEFPGAFPHRPHSPGPRPHHGSQHHGPPDHHDRPGHDRHSRGHRSHHRHEPEVFSTGEESDTSGSEDVVPDERFGRRSPHRHRHGRRHHH